MTNEITLREDAKSKVLQKLADGFSGYWCDFHNEVFNTDYYIIGTAKAEKALTEYGVFEAMKKVKNYEMQQFGECYCDLTNAEKLVNMLFYIVGDEFLAEETASNWLNENWGDMADDETCKEFSKVVETM